MSIRIFGFSIASLIWSTLSFAESSIQYHHGRVTMKYKTYMNTPAETSMPVFEISLLDSSGALSAGINNASAQYAAREGAVAEAKREVREGEALPGPKMISYSWQEQAAQGGDVKRWGLRMGSTEGMYSLSNISGHKSQKYSSLAEFFLIGNIDRDVWLTTDYFMIRGDTFWGFRLGLFRHVDQTTTGPTLNPDRKIDSGYFTLPLTYRIGLITPIRLHLYLEAGFDPVTAIRHYGSKRKDKIPNDILITPSVEFRVFQHVGIGMRVEEYRGSMIQSDRYDVVNPEYKQRMVTGFINISG